MSNEKCGAPRRQLGHHAVQMRKKGQNVGEAFVTGQPGMNRRDFLKFCTALAGSASSMAIAGPSQIKRGNDAGSLLSRYLLAIFGPADRLAIFWQTGIRYALIDDTRIPLHGVEEAIFARRITTPGREQEPGPRLVLGSLSYCTDLKHLRLLESFRNPVTQTINHVLQQSSRPTMYVPVLTRRHEYGRSMEFPANTAYEDIDTRHTRFACVTPLPRHGIRLQYIDTDSQVNQIEMRSTVPNRNQRAAYTTRCPAGLQRASAWPTWLQMDHQPGWAVTEMWCSRFTSLSDLPNSFLISARRIHPWIIRDPMDWLNVKIRF